MRHAALAILILTLTATGAVAAAMTDELAAIQANIRENGYEWRAGVTTMSLLTPEEREARLGTVLPDGLAIEPARSEATAQSSSFPARLDWRELGAVSAVKNQGGCGSCWAFATIAAMESQAMIVQGWEPDLSEQQLVSCNTRGYSCGGGWFDVNHDIVDSGAVLEDCMPYEASDAVDCAVDACHIGVQPVGWHYVSNDIDSLKTALQSGPVACAMTVYPDFNYYTGGCYENAGVAKVNHGVLLVGWDDDMCGGVWIVKNSWGTGWGERGFFYIKYDSCKIGTGAHTITIDGDAPTPPPAATPTPGETPSPDPTAEPTTNPGQLTADVVMGKTHLRPGDRFNLEVRVDNPGAQLVRADLFVILDVQGSFYFWPTWQADRISKQLRQYGGGITTERVLNFTWPTGVGSADGIAVWGALTEPNCFAIMSVDVEEFSFSE